MTSRQRRTLGIASAAAVLLLTNVTIVLVALPQVGRALRPAVREAAVIGISRAGRRGRRTSTRATCGSSTSSPRARPARS